MAEIEHAWIHSVGRDTSSSGTFATLLTLDVSAPANGDAAVGNATYLVVVNHTIDHNSAADHVRHKIVHGSTDFAESVARREHRASGSGRTQAIGYATIFTQPSTPEDITIQGLSDTPTDFGIRNSTILTIRLDADLTENTDWWEAEDDDIASPVALTTTPVAFASQTLTTVTDAEYLVIGFARTDCNVTNTSYTWDLSAAGTVTARDIVEQEDVDEQRTSFMFTSFVESSGQSRTFEMLGSVSGATDAPDHNFSRILVFRMDGVFTDFSRFQNTAGVTRSTTPTEIAGIAPTLSTTQDVLLLAGATDDNNNSAFGSGSRIQEGGSSIVDLALGGTMIQHSQSYDARDEPWFGYAFMHAAQSSTQDYDYDAEASSIVTAGNWTHRNLMMWGMELAAGDVTNDMAAVPAGSASVTAGLEQLHELAATLAGTAAAVANLEQTNEATATLAGVATVAGNLKQTQELAATVAATGTIAATLVEQEALAAVVSGVGAVTGGLEQLHALAATPAAASTVAADLKQTNDLTATIAATATVTAALVELVTLTATVTATASVTAGLVQFHLLATAPAGVATIGAGLEQTNKLAGAVTGTVAVTADLINQALLPLEATVTAVAAATGDLTQTNALAATVAGSAAVTATLQELEALTATVAGTVAVTGDLTQTNELVAVVAATGAVTAVLKELEALTVTMAATAAVTADLIQVQSLTATVTAVAAVAAVLDQVNELAATPAAAAALTAALTAETVAAATRGAVTLTQQLTDAVALSQVLVSAATLARSSANVTLTEEL